MSSQTVPAVLDRLVDVEPGRHATAVKAVTNTWSLLDSHFPRFPVLPGVLLLEAMTATATLAAGDIGRDWRLAAVRNVRFRHFVRPGDLVEITVTVDGFDDATAFCKARAVVEGDVVASAALLRLTDHCAYTGQLSDVPAVAEALR